MRLLPTMFRWAAISALAALFFAGPLYAEKDDAPAPKEWGVYVKTGSKLVRILPNVVFDARIPYLESNRPARFPLKDIEYFVMYGKREMQYLTLNNLVFINETLGKPRFMFGKEVETEVKNRGDVLYTVRPKGLFGRGYYALWINDSAWDFIVE